MFSYFNIKFKLIIGKIDTIIDIFMLYGHFVVLNHGDLKGLSVLQV